VRSLIALSLFLASIIQPARAVEPEEVLADAALEARARAISRELRCVVCQSQSIDDSNAPLAKDMRLIVRERLVAGDSDQEVFQFLASRYGDYVLLKPPVQSNTLFLWAAPAVILLIAMGAATIYLVNIKRLEDKAETANASPDDDKAA